MNTRRSRVIGIVTGASLMLALLPAVSAFADIPVEEEMANSSEASYQDSAGIVRTCSYSGIAFFEGWQDIDTNIIDGTWSYTGESQCPGAVYMSVRASMVKGTSQQGTVFNSCQPCLNTLTAQSTLDCTNCTGTWTLRTEHTTKGGVWLQYPSNCYTSDFGTTLTCVLSSSVVVEPV